MEFRTISEIKRADETIDYSSGVMMMGSCFAGEIGRQFRAGKMNVLINPFGVLYNPLSTARSLEMIMEGKTFRREDLHHYDNKYLSFYHDTGFSSRESSISLDRINRSISCANDFLSSATFLFITYGTAWVYRWKENKELVANCHKIPAAQFTRHLLTREDILKTWQDVIVQVRNFNRDLKIVFTVSPVRHLKDGAHGNQVSKATLLMAIEDMIAGDNDLSYFPSYEIMLDDLRDYRFYAKDMVHPSDAAIEYIWEKFRECYFSPGTNTIYARVKKITDARNHKITGDDVDSINEFSQSILQKISNIKKDFPGVDMEEEEKYFSDLLT